MNVAIVKYNAGNIYSVSHALKRLGVEPCITADPQILLAADKSEAELLASVCCKLGVPEKDIQMTTNGRNTGENIQAVKKMLSAGTNVIWSVTKRLSLRLERSVKQQAPELISTYYVIEESLPEACKLMNGKGLAQNEMMFHELASILQRCIAYAGTYQAPIDEIITIMPHIREADHYLRKHYKLKLMNIERRSL